MANFEHEIEAAVAQFRTLITEQLAREEKMEAGATKKNFDGSEKIVIGVCGGDGIGPIITKEAERVLQFLLKDDVAAGKVEIRIQSTENCYYASAIGTYAKAFPGLDYYTDSYPKLNPFILPEGVEKGTFINFGTADVKVLQEGIELELYEAKDLTWNSNFPMDDSGVVQLEVVNNRISTPKTGDDNAVLVGVASIGAIGAGITLYVLTYVGKTKKKENEKERV